MTISRTVLQPGISVALVSALAVAPVLAAPLSTVSPAAVANVSAPAVSLSAAVRPADIDKLIANLNRELDQASAIVTGLVGVPGRTLLDALDACGGRYGLVVLTGAMGVGAAMIVERQ